MNSVIRKIKNRSSKQTLFCGALGERRTGMRGGRDAGDQEGRSWGWGVGVGSDECTPVSTRSLVGFGAFYIQGFQVSFLSNKALSWEASGSDITKETKDLWKWLPLKCREEIFWRNES